MSFIDQYYLDQSGGLHFLTAQDQANAAALGLPLPDSSWTVATTAQVTAAQSPTNAQLWENYQATAKSALAESDKTVLRCYESGVTVPAAWATYRKALRSIVGAPTPGDPMQPLPAKPSYPAGT